MATAKTTPFEELTRLASDFVTSQKGTWDHAAWTDFLSRVQKNGVEISEEMHSRLGELLEAMKEYHAAISSTDDIEKVISTVLSDSVAFIKRQKGVWGHAEWEDFVKTMQKNTRAWSEGTEAYLGGVLESLKAFYVVSPVAAAQKSAPAVPRKKSTKKSSPAKQSKKAKEKKT